jgi:Protein of unknown function (DUF3714).
MSNTEKKPLDSKLLAIIILPIVALFLGYFMLFYDKTGKENKGAYTDNNKALIIPDAKSDSAEKLKTDAYAREEQEKRAESQKSSSVNESDFFGLVDKDPKEKSSAIPDEQEKQPEKSKSEPVKEKVRVVYVNKEGSTKKTKSDIVSNQPQKENYTQPVKREEENSGGFGIYQAKSSNTKSKENTSPSSQKDEFYPAYLEEDTKIKNNGSVVFVLSKDVYIGGVFYKKNSTLFGKVSDAGNYFDIKIRNIKTTDGNSYTVNLVVYNENYSRGIVYEGKIDKAVKEASDETVNDVSTTATGTTTEEGIRLAARGVDNGIKALTRQRQVVVNLYQGYKIYLKSE